MITLNVGDAFYVMNDANVWSSWCGKTVLIIEVSNVTNFDYDHYVEVKAIVDCEIEACELSVEDDDGWPEVIWICSDGKH